MHERAFRRAAALSAAILLLVAGGAFADTLAPNPDAITVDGSGRVDLGTVAPGAVLSFGIPFRLTCDGTSHVNKGAYVLLTPNIASGPGAIDFGNATIGPVSGFPQDGNDCFDPPQVVSSGSPSQVTITAPTTPGTLYTYSLRYVVATSDGDTQAVPAFAWVDIILDVVGDQPPTLTLPGPLTVEGDTVGGATVTYSATASDPEDGPLTPDCSPVSGSFFPLGTASVSCTATDSAGQTTNGAFDVTVVDTTPPSIGPLAAVEQTPGDPSGVVADYALPSAVDLVDPSPSVTCVPAPGTWVPVGTTTVTCTASDASGNVASATFPLIVSDPPSVTHQVTFDEPIGPTDAIVVNPGRTLPVKARVLQDGVPVSAGPVDLVVSDCGSGSRLDGPLPMSLQNDRWVRELDTSAIGACARGTVRLDGTAVGSFEMTASPSSLATPAAKGHHGRH